MKPKSALASVGVLVVGVLAGGIAYAAIPGAGGTIQGCYAKQGDLRVVESASGCKKGEHALSWNQVGQPGTDGTNGAPGVSPTVAQLQPGDSHCPAGGAAITDAAATTAYVCSGQKGTDGAAGAPFSGTFTSGNYSISVTDAGITLKRTGGPSITLVGDDITVKSNVGTATVQAQTATVEGTGEATLKGARATVEGTSLTDVKGALLRLNGGAKPVARVGDTVNGSTVVTGSPTVMAG